jgi:hypothetical protein
MEISKMDKFEKFGPYTDEDASSWFIPSFDPRILKIDQNYQRKATDSKVSSFSQNWNPKAAGCLYASLRSNGDIYNIDGNHRKLAAEILGKSVNVLLYDFTDELEPEIAEAQLFIQFNKFRSGMSGLALLNAEFCAEIPHAKRIVKAVRTYGLNVNEHYQNPETLKCVSLLKTAEKSGNLPEVLQFVSTVSEKDHSKNKTKLLRSIKEQKFLEVIYSILVIQDLTISNMEDLGNNITAQDISDITDIIGTSKGDGKFLKNGIPQEVMAKLPHLFQKTLLGV